MGKEAIYTIELAFTQEINPDFVSRSIMRWEKSPYSHVMCLFKDENDKESLFHSIGSGAQIGPDSYLETHKIVSRYEVPLLISKEAFLRLIRARSQKAVDYSQSQYVNQFFRLLFGVFGSEVPSWFPKVRNGDFATICSEEMAVSVLRYSVLWDDFMFKIDPDQISPRMLEDILLQSTEVKKLI